MASHSSESCVPFPSISPNRQSKRTQNPIWRAAPFVGDVAEEDSVVFPFLFFLFSWVFYISDRLPRMEHNFPFLDTRSIACIFQLSVTYSSVLVIFNCLLQPSVLYSHAA
jgi:hypothetical protein